MSEEELVKNYTGSLSLMDRKIFSILKGYSSDEQQVALESMPLFGNKARAKKINPLYAHSVRANTVLATLNPEQAFTTAMKFQEDFLTLDTNSKEDEANLKEFYDFRFMLPLISHVLDEKNICDVVKVISNGWIYFIVRGLGLRDDLLRNVAFLAFKRLIFNLHLAKGFRLQDVKIWLHFLLGIRNGIIELKECRLTPLLSVWMVATCEVLRQPVHPLYPKVTHFLLAKPTIDLTVLPDFTSFFNASDGNRETREWILNILHLGLKTKSDWTLAKKVPTIKYMCSLFSLEKIQTQRIILNILSNGAKIPEVAHDMVDRHSLLLWIANVTIDEKKHYRRELEDIYRNLSLNCPAGNYRNYVFRFVALKHNWSYVRMEINSTTADDYDC